MRRIPFFDWRKALGLTSKPTGRMGLERGEHLLQGRGGLHAEAGESGRDFNGPRLKSAPVQVSFHPMSQTSDQQAAQALVAEAESAGETLARVRAEIGKAVRREVTPRAA